MRTTPKEMRYDKMGPAVVENFKKRGFDAYYCMTKEAALEKSISLIPGDDIVSWGGSVTIKQVGLLDRIKEDYETIDRDKSDNPIEAMREALLSDTFLMGSNAATEDGQLVNIDGNGNRVAALCYGPRQVIVIIGLNKIKKTLEDAMNHARTVEAPLNCQRFPVLKTPCNATGMCNDCNSADSICNQILITRRCKPLKRIKVIIIGEDLGF